MIKKFDNSKSKGKFVRTKKAAPFDLERLFTVVDRRMELSDHFHRDLAVVKDYLETL